jgi:hypothetical protein
MGVFPFLAQPAPVLNTVTYSRKPLAQSRVRVSMPQPAPSLLALLNFLEIYLRAR